MDSKLVSVFDVKKSIGIRGFGGNIIACIVLWILGFAKINKKYGRIALYSGRDFTAAALKEFGVSFEINEKELDYIPQCGPFIVVSNHPYGAIEGIILLHIISSVRPDVKFMTNFMLSRIPNLKEYFLPVNPFTENPELATSYSGLRMSMKQLMCGGALVLFPAGEVSTTYGTTVIKDKDWQASIIKLIKNAGVPVLPVYVHGTNSRFFHYIGKIHSVLRTVRLPAELLNKKGKNIKICMGKIITYTEISEYKENKAFGDFLRARCYALEANVSGEKMDKIVVENKKKPMPVALPKNRWALQKEINALSPDKHLFTNGNYSCYLTESASIPLMMHELGRRREEAFRSIGEGTGLSLDIDEYDVFYKHLILWDRNKAQLVGAYRLGFGPEIMRERGMEGFYSQTLFLYKEPFTNILKESIELGRSFVALEYQKEALPLMLLIKGIFYSLLNNPDIKYLLGPVSISSWYPEFYRSLMIYYIMQRYSIKEMRDYVVPRNPFFPDFLRSDPEYLLGNKIDSIEKFDRYLLKLSNQKYRLPTLVKKYLKINCRIINFNVDPDFNYCVDGLVLLNLGKVAQSEIEALAKNEKDLSRIKARFGF